MDFFKPRRRHSWNFRPALEVLEDRTVPSATGGLFGAALATPGPATHLEVIVPESTQAGKTFEVIVKALDASNHVATGYTGTVDLSLGTPETGAKLPAAFQFTAASQGIHVFSVSLPLTTSEQFTATDSVNALSGSAITDATTEVATTVLVIVPEAAATGVETYVEVEVLDQAGQVMRNFTGAVTLSSDTTATGAPNHHTAATSLPITYDFTAKNDGEHGFLVTFNTPITGATPATVTATTSSPALSGTAQLTLYPRTTVTHFGLFVNHFAATGSATQVTLEALNASNQIVPGYNGTVTFSSSDTAASISTTKGGTSDPINGFTYQFTTGTGADNGKHIFWVDFANIGPQSLAVVDSTNSLSDSVSVQVIKVAPPPNPNNPNPVPPPGPVTPSAP